MLFPFPSSGSFPCPLFESSAFNWLFWFPQKVSSCMSGSGFLQLTSAPGQQRIQLRTQLQRGASEECQFDSQDVSSSWLFSEFWIKLQHWGPDSLEHWPRTSAVLWSVWLCEKHPCWFGELPKSQSPDNSSRFMVFAFLGMSQSTLLCWAAPVIFQQLPLFPSHYVFLLKFPFKEWFMQQGKAMTWLPPQFPSLCTSCAVPSKL